jgi:three-Cys-motif partner protein
MDREKLAPYAGREQASVKHFLLESYLARLIMITARARFDQIVYVDAFAGPWKSARPDLSDTSFAKALEVMESCRVEIAKNLGKSVTFRALFVERDPERYSVLKRFADERSNNRIEVRAINEDFAESAQSVAQWIRDDEMAFVLIDPTGWKEVISPKTLAPLLRKRNVEMLINVMWNFINLATAHASQEHSLEEIFGDQFKALLKAARMASSGEPLMRGYLRRLRDFAGGQSSSTRLRTAWFPVEFPAAERVFYYLVYVTHHVKGMIVFLEESEKALQFQSKVKFVVKQQRREVSSGMDDLFGDELQLPNIGAAVHGARDAWIALLPEVNSELHVDEGRMADMAEECGCLISQLQESLRLLLEARVLENVDAKRPRTKNHVNYHKGEVIRRLK